MILRFSIAALFLIAVLSAFRSTDPENGIKSDGVPSFQKEILPIIESTCSIEDCHDGVQPPDLRTFKKIVKSAEEIKVRINDTRYPMPPEGVPDVRALTASEKQLLMKWIDNGAPEN